MTKSRYSFARRILLPLVLANAATTASEMVGAAQEQTEEYQQLLELLQEQTTIATKTRLNADYVPGMVTVLHGDDMEAYGSRTVWEALSKVPGIELSIEETGRKQIVIRGIGRTYASGNVKIMLNGMAMNSAQIAYANPVLNIPIEQVERLEIIRGPGSAIHGEFAYTGVVNVITRSGEKKLFARVAEGQHRGAGGLYHFRDPDRDFSIDLNIGRWRENGVTVTAEEDALYAEGLAANSNAPGPTNEAQDDTTAILSLKHKAYSLNMQWLEDGSGDYFGINEYLPPDENAIVTRYRSQNVELVRQFENSEAFNAKLYVSWQRNEEEKDGLFIGNASLYGLTGYPFVVNTDYREERVNAGIDTQWRITDKHQVLAAYSYSSIQARHNDKSYGQEGGTMSPFDGLISPETSRHINSLTLQDEYHPSEPLTLTLGLRHDEYSDVGNSTMPRLAAVYRISRKHILKAQYARAFRPPTFYELGGMVDDIDPSTIETYEAGYIFRGINNDLRLTLFRSILDNPIVFFDTPSTLGFVNTEGASQYGSEIEWNHRFSSRFDITGNLSYLQTEDDITGEPFAGSSDWLANLGLNFRPSSRTLLNLHYRYVDKAYRDFNDGRESLDGYSTLDLTYNLLSTSTTGYKLRLGVKNMLDEEVRYPAPVGTYPGDRPRPGRLWWAGLSYHF